MTYRRALLTRWSRRDRLAVLVVGVAVAFLTGTTLVVLAVGSSTAGVAAEYGTGSAVTIHDSVAAAEEAAGPDAAVLPLAEVEGPNGTTTVVGGRANGTLDDRAEPPRGGTLGTIDAARIHRLKGRTGAVDLHVAPRDESPIPADWYRTNGQTVTKLGPTGALVVEPAEGVPARGVPLQGVLAFFVAGTRSALATLSVAAAVGATLVGVTVYSVTRMTVRDRLRELAVLRATGTSRWRVRRLFLARGVLLVGLGVALGYALGVIVINLAVTLAVSLGVSTSLATRVTGRAVAFLVPTYAGVLLVGGLATLAAVEPVVRRPPARIGDVARGYDRSPLGTRLLSARTAVPTAATLAAFVTFLLVVAGLAGVAGPLAVSDTATITEPGSTHPIASQVPAAYAEPVRDRGIAASPEILLFAVRDGQPFPARGAEYASFAAVSDARLVRGRPPASPDEAVVGMDLAATLDVDVGDRIIVGGSVRPALTRVQVVGAFAAPGSHDDQLVVSLPTARHLTNVDPGQVNFIRADRLPPGGHPSNGTAVTDVSAPATAPAGEPFPVRVTVRNDGLEKRTATPVVRVAGEEYPVDVTVPANEQRTASVTLTLDDPGQYQLRVGEVRENVTVLQPEAVRLQGLPGRAPPDSAPRVRVVDAAGDPIHGATVRTRSWHGQTGADGQVRVPLGDPGEYRVTATRSNHSNARIVTVATNATREFDVTGAVTPRRPSLLDEPTFAVTVANPWNRTLTRTLTVTAPGGPYSREASVPPGGERSLDVRLPRRPPGQYDVRVSVGERTLATTSYRVTGDDRIVAALATSGRSGTTGIGQAAEVALGNLQLALGALVLLGAGMSVGATAAAFAGGVHANRTTIGVHRAVGATRWQVARLVAGDALRIGGVAVVAGLLVGVAALELLDAAGLLTVYGVRMAVVPSWPLLGAVAAGSLLVVGVGAGLATVAVLARQPADLLGGGDRR